MTKIRKFLIHVVFAFFIALPFMASNASASVINAASCSQGDVTTAYNLAQEGDTIKIPAGSCTWSSTLVIARGVTLQGAGAGNTTITCRAGNDNQIIEYFPSFPANNTPFRITGFTFNLNSDSGVLYMASNSLIPQTKIRIDHNNFENAVFSAPVFVIAGQFYGVVYNNVFGNSPHIDNYGIPDGVSNWMNFAFNYGSADCLYYEDNVIRADDTLFSGGNGGRYCFRYNTITSDPRTRGSWGLYPFLDAHGNMGPGGNYATMGVEIYGNKLTMINSLSPGYNFLDHRGGKGLVFNNRVITDYPNVQGGTVREEHSDIENPPANNTIDGTPQHVNNAYYWNNRNIYRC